MTKISIRKNCRVCSSAHNASRHFFKKLKKRNSTETVILWVLIYFFLIFVINFLLPRLVPQLLNWQRIILSLFFLIVIIIGRYYEMQVKAFFTILSLIIASLGLFVQTEALRTNLKQMQLDKRPYLYATIQPMGGQKEKEAHFGGKINFKNVGVFPARNVKYEILLETNSTFNLSSKFTIWYSDTYGALPQFTFVPPKGETAPITYFPSVPSKSDFATIGIVVSYNGFDPVKTYWHILRLTYRLGWDQKGKLSGMYLIGNIEDADDDFNFVVPKLTVPDWSAIKLGKIEPITAKQKRSKSK